MLCTSKTDPGKYSVLLDRSSSDFKGNSGFCTGNNKNALLVNWSLCRNGLFKQDKKHLLKVLISCVYNKWLIEYLPVRLAIKFPEYVAQTTTKQKAIIPVAKRKEPSFGWPVPSRKTVKDVIRNGSFLQCNKLVSCRDNIYYQNYSKIYCAKLFWK